MQKNFFLSKTSPRIKSKKQIKILPVIILKVVVLPAPLTPIKPKHSPLLIPSEILLTATCLLLLNFFNFLQTFVKFVSLMQSASPSTSPLSRIGLDDPLEIAVRTRLVSLATSSSSLSATGRSNLLTSVGLKRTKNLSQN